jgi:hypothetical protein
MGPRHGLSLHSPCKGLLIRAREREKREKTEGERERERERERESERERDLALKIGGLAERPFVELAWDLPAR